MKPQDDSNAVKFGGQAKEATPVEVYQDLRRCACNRVISRRGDTPCYNLAHYRVARGRSDRTSHEPPAQPANPT